MSEPRRIQRKRTKGWKMPDGAVYVGRPTRWGNPFRAALFAGPRWVVIDDNGVDYTEPPGGWTRKADAALKATRLFYMDVAEQLAPYPPLSELRGKDLVCWCPLEDGQGNRFPCHADVLLELANQ